MADTDTNQTPAARAKRGGGHEWSTGEKFAVAVAGAAAVGGIVLLAETASAHGMTMAPTGPVPAPPNPNNPAANRQPVPVPQHPANTSAQRTVVRVAQQQLRDLGYNPGTADGVLGPNTQSAVLRFLRAQPATASRDALIAAWAATYRVTSQVQADTFGAIDAVHRARTGGTPAPTTAAPTGTPAPTAPWTGRPRTQEEVFSVSGQNVQTSVATPPTTDQLQTAVRQLTEMGFQAGSADPGLMNLQSVQAAVDAFNRVDNITPANDHDQLVAIDAHYRRNIRPRA